MHWKWHISAHLKSHFDFIVLYHYYYFPEEMRNMIWKCLALSPSGPDLKSLSKDSLLLCDCFIIKQLDVLPFDVDTIIAPWTRQWGHADAVAYCGSRVSKILSVMRTEIFSGACAVLYYSSQKTLIVIVCFHTNVINKIQIPSNTLGKLSYSHSDIFINKLNPPVAFGQISTFSVSSVPTWRLGSLW